jgi:GNAT superfamily N-acetyltransferase
VIEYTDVIIKPEYAKTVDNWLIAYQNANGKNINRAKVKNSDFEGMYALHDGELVGWLTIRLQSDWIFLHCGYVLPEYRGKGIFKKILRHLEKLAEAEKLSGIFTSTYTFEAPHIYESLGFIKGSELTDCPKGNTSIDYYKRITL